MTCKNLREKTASIGGLCCILALQRIELHKMDTVKYALLLHKVRLGNICQVFI